MGMGGGKGKGFVDLILVQQMHNSSKQSLKLWLSVNDSM